MGLRRISQSVLFCLLLGTALSGCGSDEVFDPNESEKTRAIREKVRADMEAERLQRYAPRIAHAIEAAAAAPTATSVHLASTAGHEETAESSAEPAVVADPGEALYGQNCASCHGPRGGGDGPVGASLNPQPAKHTDGAYMNALSNDHLFKVIKEGGGAVGKSLTMAAWGGSMSDQQIRDVVVFVRSLAEPPYTGPLP